MKTLELEVSKQFVFDKIDQRDGVAEDPNKIQMPDGTFVIASPWGGEDNWAFRVMVSDTQAIIGYEKHKTIGIGFMVEDANGNTNLSYSEDAQRILGHILVNKGNDSIADERCLEAIRMVQAAAKKWMDFQYPKKDLKELEPLMFNEKGKHLTKKAFAERCFIEGRVRQSKLSYLDETIKARKYIVLFGRDENLRWKYRFDLYCTKGKGEAIQRAMEAVDMLNTSLLAPDAWGKLPMPIRINERFEGNYNQKIPLAF